MQDRAEQQARQIADDHKQKMTDFTTSGAVPFPEVVQPIWDEINETYGTDYELPFDE